MLEQGVSYFYSTADLWAMVGPGSSWWGTQRACFGFQPNCHLQHWNSSSSFAVTTEFCECAFRVKVMFSFLSFGELYHCFFYFLICKSNAYSLEEDVRKYSTKKKIKKILNSCNVNGEELKEDRGCSYDGMWKVPFANCFPLSLCLRILRIWMPPTVSCLETCLFLRVLGPYVGRFCSKNF